MKGHDAKAVEAYNDFSEKFLRISQKSGALSKADRDSVSQAMGLLLFGLNTQYKSVEKVANDWF